MTEEQGAEGECDVGAEPVSSEAELCFEERTVQPEGAAAPEVGGGHRWLAPVVLVLAGLSILPAAWLTALHCDEFVVLQHVSDFYRGQFQGAGRPGLLWMLLMPLVALKNPVWITLAVRMTALLASVGTIAGVWWLAERAARPLEQDPPDEGVGRSSKLPWYGLSAAFLLLSSMDWQGHSFEVRTDTYVVPLTFLAIALLWRAELSLKSALLVGLVVAATGLISQKSLYNAVGLGTGWLLLMGVLLSHRRLRLGRQLLAALLAVAAALLAVGLWYGLMAWLQSDTGFISAQVSGAMKTAFKESIAMTNKWRALRLGMGLAPALWTAAALGVVLALWQARRRPLWLSSLGFVAVMLSTIFFHRGFFLYYIASFEPYVAILAAAVVGSICHWLSRRVSPWLAAAFLALLVAIQVGQSLGPYQNMLAANNGPQLSVMREAVEAFPEAVPYWDAIGMVPGYEETTFFGTALGRRWFRQSSGRNGFIARARTRKPHFYIRNYMTRRRYLRPAERRWLWTHYLPYRNNLYIHGGRMKVSPEVAEKPVELLVTGDYTVWFRGGWSGEASLDGEPVQHGEIVSVAEGKHVLRARSTAGNEAQFWLMLGRDRRPATERAEQQVDYSMFTLLARGRYQQYDDKKNERSDLRTPDHDPTIGRVNEKKRHRRHRRWQSKVNRSDGSP